MGWFASTLQTACEEDLKANNNMAVDTLIGEFKMPQFCHLNAHCQKLYSSQNSIRSHRKFGFRT
jgi:hypothetical protein